MNGFSGHGFMPERSHLRDAPQEKFGWRGACLFDVRPAEDSRSCQSRHKNVCLRLNISYTNKYMVQRPPT